VLIRSPVAIFCLVLLLCLLTAGGHLYSPDEEIMYRVTESIGSRGRLDVRPIEDGAGGTFATQRGVNGLEYAQYGIGNSLFAVPLYWVGAALSKVIESSAAEQAFSFLTTQYLPPGEPAGHALLKRFCVSFFGAFVAAATAALVWLFAELVLFRATLIHRRGHDNSAVYEHRRSIAGMVALSYAIGTMAWPHARTYFSEPLATFFCLLAFYWAAKYPHLRTRYALLSGCAFALALLTRLDSLMLAPALALLLFFSLRRIPEPDPAAPVVERSSWPELRSAIVSRINWPSLLKLKLFALPVVIFGLVHLSLNHLHFGSAFTTAYADQREGINFSTPILAGLYGFFMSVGKSVFLFSPAIILGCAGWSRFFSADRLLAAALALAVILKVGVQSTWQNWPGGWCWGPRHIFLAHAFAIVPAVWYFANFTPLKRYFAHALLLVGAFVQIYGSSQSFIDFYMLYYRTPYTPPQATVMFAPDDTAPGIFRVEKGHPERGWQPVPVAGLIAPINDSIYVPQNSQWYRYADMWNMGYTDNLWLRLLQRSRDREQPVE